MMNIEYRSIFLNEIHNTFYIVQLECLNSFFNLKARIKLKMSNQVGNLIFFVFTLSILECVTLAFKFNLSCFL